MTGPRTSTWTGTSAPADFYGNPHRACTELDVEVFYSAADTDQELARDTCRRCPFEDACLDYALDRGEEHGVWGAVLMSAPGERGAARQRRNWHAKTPEQQQQQIAAIHDPGRTELKAFHEQQVRALWEQGHSDSTIALKLDLTHGAVARIRTRIKLPALYGPGGRPINRERVPA